MTQVSIYCIRRFAVPERRRNYSRRWKKIHAPQNLPPSPTLPPPFFHPLILHKTNKSVSERVDTTVGFHKSASVGSSCPLPAVKVHPQNAENACGRCRVMGATKTVIILGDIRNDSPNPALLLRFSGDVLTLGDSTRLSATHLHVYGTSVHVARTVMTEESLESKPQRLFHSHS
jgi:hypothetical protein